ncbi:MAG: hypothetical protein HXY34_07000 [Candidatus Thorarchaeota archaeon]|nr:hypothetical protein [Candidatus Thorarchaeota archaeon]
MLLGLPYYLIVVIPLAGSLFVPLVGRFNERLRDWTPAILMGISMVLCWSLLGDMDAPQGPTSWVWIASLNLHFELLIDPLSVIMAILSSTLCFLIYVYSTEYMAHEGDRDRFFFLMLAFGGGMLTLVLSNNLLIAFIGWEIMGFCSYGLIGFWTDRRNPPETDPTDVKYGNSLLSFKTEGQYNTHCGTKAFIVTRVGDAFMLGGILLLFAFAGTFSFTGTESLSSNANDWWGGLAAIGLLIPTLLLIFMGAIGKSGQVPLQVWLPEAMAGPTSVSALIHAATMVKAGVYITARFVVTIAGASGISEGGHGLWTPLQQVGMESAFTFFLIVGVIGGLTAFMTATMGMVSMELKQVLAFSTLSQLGYMMLALGTAGMLGTHYEPAYLSSVLHVVSHGAFKALLFLAAGGVIHATHTKYMTKMGGLRSKMPKTFAVMVIGVLALSGIPPFSGFWSKDSIIEYAYELALHESVGLLLFVLAVGAAACTIFYSIRLVGMTFLGSPHESPAETTTAATAHDDSHRPDEEHKDEGHDSGAHHASEPHDPGPAMMIPLYVLAAFTVFAFAVFPFIQSLVMHEGPMTPELYAGLLLEMMWVKVSPEGIVPFGITLLALAAGAIPAWRIYVRGAGRHNRVIPETGLARRVYSFLRHRWYINESYYWLVGKFLRFTESWRVRIDNRVIDGIDFGSARAARVLSKKVRWFDDNVIDGFAEGIAKTGISASESSQTLQTGRVNDYVGVMIFGTGLILILVLIVMGVI